MAYQNKVLQSNSFPEKLRKWAPEAEGHTLLALGAKKFKKGWTKCQQTDYQNKV